MKTEEYAEQKNQESKKAWEGFSDDRQIVKLRNQNQKLKEGLREIKGLLEINEEQAAYIKVEQLLKKGN